MMLQNQMLLLTIRCCCYCSMSFVTKVLQLDRCLLVNSVIQRLKPKMLQTTEQTTNARLSANLSRTYLVVLFEWIEVLFRKKIFRLIFILGRFTHLKKTLYWANIKKTPDKTPTPYKRS